MKPTLSLLLVTALLAGCSADHDSASAVQDTKVTDSQPQDNPEDVGGNSGVSGQAEAAYPEDQGKPNANDEANSTPGVDEALGRPADAGVSEEVSPPQNIVAENANLTAPNYAVILVDLKDGSKLKLAASSYDGSKHLKCEVVQNGKVKCEEYRYSWSPIKIMDGINNAIAVASGFGHACALIQDGSVECRSVAGLGHVNLEAAEKIKDAIKIAAGGDNTCVIRQNKTVSCWGYMFGGYHSHIKLDFRLTNPRNLAVNKDAVCVEFDEGVECRGRNDSNTILWK